MTVHDPDRNTASRGRLSTLAALLALFAGTTCLVVLDARPAEAQFGMRGFGMHGARGRPNFVRPGRIPNVNQAHRMPNMRMMPQGQRMPGGMGRVGRNPDMAIGRRGTPGYGQGGTTYVPGRGPGRGPVVTIPRGPVAEVPRKPGGPVTEVPRWPPRGPVTEVPHGPSGPVVEVPRGPRGPVVVVPRWPRGPDIGVGWGIGGGLPPGGVGGRPPPGGGFGGGGGGFPAAAAAAAAGPATMALIQAARAGGREVVGTPPGLPPQSERRYMSDEVLFVLRPNAPEADIRRVVRRFNLTLISEQRSELIGTAVYRYRVPNGQDVPSAIRAMTRDPRVAYVQPNYLFARPNYVYQLKSSTSIAAGGASLSYVVDTLRLPEAHLLARGERVPIAVIDSGIDANHPEIAGRITKRFDAVGGPFQAHEHGTGMAGAIIAHAQLTGVSPRADILAARAFAPGQSTGASGTSFHILQAMDWSIREGARVINMSFAGPRDPVMTRAIQVAAARRIALIAAMGNEGPNAPISFPAADPNVIAVTAVDRGGHVFDAATRGNHVAVAAPGVEVLLPAPQGGYQISSGTSVAAAHVSGIAALILERSPNLDPATLRQILRETARRGAVADPQLGAGLADPVPALNAATAPHPAEPPAPMAVAPAPLPETVQVPPQMAAPRPATVDPKTGK